MTQATHFNPNFDPKGQPDPTQPEFLVQSTNNKDVPSEIISTQCAPRQTNHTLESELCKNANITYLF